ncbi:DNA polymerase III subunit delta' [Paenibacillus alkalitolerans]|uniref:DNA polymerase III subunit delta' n=1 Tax=Paenibacillus alkalitolerans TaxID=2799335 RepID=UPI0018F339B6|nr:DNA polymerase III subunit delta' [Paenibacillus alkalitolerans]
MPFSDIPGQERVKTILRTALRDGALSHAYVFEGQRGTGRRSVARALAQALFCVEGGGDACGACVECRKAANGNHPDVYWIDAAGSTVKIDQIRELQKQFTYKASASRPRIYIIDEAEKMTPQASNAMLKFLEEPASQIVAVLITENGQALLPTILSRTQRIAFQPLSPEIMEEALLAEGHPAVLVRPAVRLSAGLETARELIQLNWFAETRNAVLQLAKESIHGFSAAMLAGQSIISKQEVSEHMDTFFDLFALWCKDMVLLQRRQTAKVVFIDGTEWSQRHADSKPFQLWVGAMDEALRAKKRLRQHANPQLVLERFLYTLQGG